MKIGIADNISRDVASVLSAEIARSADVRIAVAFVSKGGLEIIEPSLRSVLQKEGSVEFLIGLDLRVTEPAALQMVYDLSAANPNVVLYCHVSPKPMTVYHPKLYLLRGGDKVTAVIGSSNLTQGGLMRNIEVNVVIQADLQSEVVSDVYDTYNRLKFQQHRVAPDKEFIALYAQIHDREKTRRRAADREKSSDQLSRVFKEKIDSMQHPVPTHRDLVGWMGLVYGYLPGGEFTNQDVYAHADAFQQKFPDNQNVKAKIRQQLQFLRDLGFIEHLGHGRWRKLK